MDRRDFPVDVSVPMVIETSGRSERSFDIYSLLLRERIIFLGSEIESRLADVVIAQLLFLDREDPDKDIMLHINSPGGSVTDALAIYDTMQLIRPDVQTVCLGMAASAASFLLAAGAKGKRYCLPNSTIMLHQPSQGGGGGRALDIEVQAKEILRQRATLTKLYSLHTGQEPAKIIRDTDRDMWLNATMARDYGIVDAILESRKLAKATIGSNGHKPDGA